MGWTAFCEGFRREAIEGRATAFSGRAEHLSHTDLNAGRIKPERAVGNDTGQNRIARLARVMDERRAFRIDDEIVMHAR